MIVNHINEDRSDNMAANLEWVSRRENSIHSIGKSVVQKSLDGQVLAEFRTAGLAMESTGVSDVSIRQCCRLEAKSAGGFIWEYKGLDLAWTKKKPGRRQKAVSQYTLEGVLINNFKGALDASIALGIPVKTIRSHLAKHAKTCHGFVFRYV
jgi:hypothetical protein